MPERGTQKEEVEMSHIQYPDVPYNSENRTKKIICYLAFVKNLFPKNQQLRTSFSISLLSTLPIPAKLMV